MTYQELITSYPQTMEIVRGLIEKDSSASIHRIPIDIAIQLLGTFIAENESALDLLQDMFDTTLVEIG